MLGGDFSSSSLEQMQLKPPNKLAIMWANPSSPAAPSPNLKACSLGSLHSNIHRRKCFTYSITTYYRVQIITIQLMVMRCFQMSTLFCAISASMASKPATISIATTSRQTNTPTNFMVSFSSLYQSKGCGTKGSIYGVEKAPLHTTKLEFWSFFHVPSWIPFMGEQGK